MIVIGTFIRGLAGCGSGQGKHGRTAGGVRGDRNVDQIFGINGSWLVHLMPSGMPATLDPGAHYFRNFPILFYFIVAGYLVHRMLLLTDFSKRISIA